MKDRYAVVFMDESEHISIRDGSVWKSEAEAKASIERLDQDLDERWGVERDKWLYACVVKLELVAKSTRHRRESVSVVTATDTVWEDR